MAWNDADLAKSAMPLWAQIAERLRTAIADGEFTEGDDLPSESLLVARFGVSRATARNALSQLANEGLVERRSGKGTTVLPARVELPLNLLSSFAEDMRSRGMRPGYGRLAVTVAPTSRTIAAALGLPEGEPAIRVERLLLANDSAIAFSASWLSPELVPLEVADELRTFTSSLYTWLEEHLGIRVTHGTETIEAGVAGPDVAEQLGIPVGGAVLNATRVARVQDGRAIEYVERSYRADRYRYRIELVRP